MDRHGFGATPAPSELTVPAAGGRAGRRWSYDPSHVAVGVARGPRRGAREARPRTAWAWQVLEGATARTARAEPLRPVYAEEPGGRAFVATGRVRVVMAEAADGPQLPAALAAAGLEGVSIELHRSRAEAVLAPPDADVPYLLGRLATLRGLPGVLEVSPELVTAARRR